MGKFDFEFDKELTRQLERLSNFDEIAPRILDGAVPILERYVKMATASHHVSGDLLASIKRKTSAKNKYGWFVVVRPTGVDKKGVRNMQKMAHLEYGTSKLSPTPILSKALNDARQEVTDKMQEIFNEVVGK